MIDERDLARLGEVGTDLEDLPVAPPIDASEPEALAPPVKRRGRPPGYANRNTQAENVRLATIRQRAAKLKSDTASPEPVFTGAVTGVRITGFIPADPPPAPPDGWLTKDQAAKVLGLFPGEAYQVLWRARATIESRDLVPGCRRKGALWRADQVHELARRRR